MKIAIIHDYLVNQGGAENVLEKILELFPDAPVFTAIHKNGSVSATIEAHQIKTSFLQHAPLAKSKWQYYLPLMPKAFESIKLDEFDLIVSSSHSCAKGVTVKPSAKHICYCHTPMRYAWNLYDEYSETLRQPQRFLFQKTMKRLREWDKNNSKRVDHFIANSTAVAERIMKYYGREAEIIHPPVATDYFTLPNEERSREYYLTVARFTPYKRIDMAINVCAEIGRPLKVVGSAVGYGQSIQKSSAESSIEFLGPISGEQLRGLYRGAKAFLMPAEEDFGITAVEAQACGTPAIAFGSGGARDTVIDKETGIYFYKQTNEELAKAIESFERMEFDRQVIRKHAERFSVEAFINRMKAALSLFLSESSGLPFNFGEWS